MADKKVELHEENLENVAGGAGNIETEVDTGVETKSAKNTDSTKTTKNVNSKTNTDNSKIKNNIEGKSNRNLQQGQDNKIGNNAQFDLK